MPAREPITFFSVQNTSGIVLWRGCPDCQAAHDGVLAWLRDAGSNFRATAPGPNDNISKGNISEFIAMRLGVQFFDHETVFAANAFNPLGTISKSELDLVWIFFGPTAVEDVAILQEVKATGDSDLGYSKQLLVDYAKLFGKNPAFTLQTRLDGIKNEFEFKLKRPEFIPRIQSLSAKSPQTASQVWLAPTMVHELTGSDAPTTMLAIKSSLVATGWNPDAVEPWSIGLTDLNERLVRLAMGQN